MPGARGVLAAAVFTCLTLVAAASSEAAVSLSAPSPASGTVTVAAQSRFNAGLVELDLYIDGTIVKRCFRTSCSMSWDTTTVPNGFHRLKVVRRNGNGSMQTARETVRVVNGSTPPPSTPSSTPPPPPPPPPITTAPPPPPPPVTSPTPPADTTPPQVTLTAPSTASGSVMVSVSATDASGVTSTSLLVDNQLVTTVAGAALSFQWNTAAIGNGPHTLVARAIDTAGNTGSSASKTVTVSNSTVTAGNPPPPPPPPPAGGTTPTGGTTTTPSTTVTNLTVEWAANGSTFQAASGQFGTTGVSVEVRSTPTAHGTRYDVRLRNRSSAGGLLTNDAGTAFTQTALRVHLPRAGGGTQATIEGLSVVLPAEVKQSWQTPVGRTGIMYGFNYAITGAGAVVKNAPASTVAGQWGGRTNGVVRIDGKAYVVPDFWERFPRKITVNSNEVLLTLFEGSELLRAGEDVWDTFAVVDGTLTDATAIAEAEALPSLDATTRQALMTRFGITGEGLPGKDAAATTLLRKWDQWQGTSWNPKYADSNPARIDPEFSPDGKTTIFTLLAKGSAFATNLVEDYAPAGSYGWRHYGDLAWGDGHSALHYDWIRAGFKYYLRTGDPSALRWTMSALRHAVSVDFVWNDFHQTGDAGWARYEKGDHGGPPSLIQLPVPSHTWDEGLFLAAAITGDPWVKEAALRRVEGEWSFFGGASPLSWDGSYGELRWITWPMLIFVRAFTETGDQRYWVKAGEALAELMRIEGLSGGKGYVRNVTPVGTPNYVSVLMHGYSSRALLDFMDIAKSRGEWTADRQAFMMRMVNWLKTPQPTGPYIPASGSTPSAWPTEWCPPGFNCGPASQLDTSSGPIMDVLFADVFAWAATQDASLASIARQTVSDAILHGNHPDGIVGYLTDQFPGSETKVNGRIQLFLDRAARSLAP